jgi:hypothetical protein
MVFNRRRAACKDGGFLWILSIKAATKQNQKENEQPRKKKGCNIINECR